MAKGLIHGKQIRDNSIDVSKFNGSIGVIVKNYNGDYNLSVNQNITTNFTTTGISPTENPYTDTAIYVLVNGVKIELGDGLTNRSCYFSEDNGTTALMISDISENSVLYWNAIIANYSLSPSDNITLQYQIFDSAGVFNEFGGQSPAYYLDRANHTGQIDASDINNLSYVHDQDLFGGLSTTWTINHNLNRFPNINVIDPNGIQIEGEIDYVNSNQVIVTFNTAITGKAYLS